MHVCMYIHFCVCVCVCPSVYLSASLSVKLSVDEPSCLSVSSTYAYFLTEASTQW